MALTLNKTFWRIVALLLFAAVSYGALVYIPAEASHPQHSELTGDPVLGWTGF